MGVLYYWGSLPRKDHSRKPKSLPLSSEEKHDEFVFLSNFGRRGSGYCAVNNIPHHENYPYCPANGRHVNVPGAGIGYVCQKCILNFRHTDLFLTNENISNTIAAYYPDVKIIHRIHI
jgi:hypothetical protein